MNRLIKETHQTLMGFFFQISINVKRQMGNFFLAILYKPLKFRDLNILESATQMIKENLCFCKTY